MIRAQDRVRQLERLFVFDKRRNEEGLKRNALCCHRLLRGGERLDSVVQGGNICCVIALFRRFVVLISV